MTKPRIKRLPAAVLAVFGAIAVLHIAATLVFTGPSTPLKDSLQPGLNRYFLGPLDQGWSLFAPGPYSQDEYMLVRACVSDFETCAGGDAAGAEFTEWRNVTAEEVAQVEGNIFAGRESRQSKVVVGRTWSAALDLPDTYRDMAKANHIDGEPVFGVDLDAPEAVDEFGPGALQTLRAYERLEDVAVGLGTLYMYEEHGDAVTLVEVRLRRTAVPPFDARHNPPAEPSEEFVMIGWRPATEFPEEVLAQWR